MVEKQYVSLAAELTEADDLRFCPVFYLSPFSRNKKNTSSPYCSLLWPVILSTKEKTIDDTNWTELCAFGWPGKEAVLQTLLEKKYL